MNIMTAFLRTFMLAVEGGKKKECWWHLALPSDASSLLHRSSEHNLSRVPKIFIGGKVDVGPWRTEKPRIS